MSLSIPLNAREMARRLGAEHAIAMLRELADPQKTLHSCINDDGREGPQDIATVLTYLGTLQPQNMEGFAAVLTDFLGGALNGGAPDVELYEDMLIEGRI